MNSKENFSHLVLVRHGQSEWNAKNLFTGWKNPGLTEKGLEEAKITGEKIKEQKSLTLKKEHNIDNVSSNDFSLSANKSNPSLFCDLITNVIKGISLSTKANQHHHTAQIYPVSYTHLTLPTKA